uniref:Secreted protein n=1 Tax=Rhipicephalus appendiculatus TaxID=34631 RepID=A0A131YF46_RHIAP
MMLRLSAVHILFLAAAALLIVECLATPHRWQPARPLRCREYKCRQLSGRLRPKGCPRGCQCVLDRSNSFPKRGLCNKAAESSRRE